MPGGAEAPEPPSRRGTWAKQGLGPHPAPEPLHALAADRVPVAASSCPVTGYTKGDTFPQRPLNPASKAGGKGRSCWTSGKKVLSGTSV